MGTAQGHVGADQHELSRVDETSWVSCNFEVSAEFFNWDSVDEENLPLGSGTAEFEEEVVIPVFVTISGDLLKGDPKSWHVGVEVSQQDFWIDAGEMEPDWLSERDPEDD